MSKNSTNTKISVIGKINSTCPAPFVQQGSVHRLIIRGNLQFSNPNSVTIPISVILKIKANGGVLEEQQTLLVVPASPSELDHTISTDYQYTAQSGHTRIMILLTVLQENFTDPIVSYWYPCEFTVQQ